jgi:hypothetical protein
MARRTNKTNAKTFQQRQTERRGSDAEDRAVVEDMASTFACSNAIARDFAGQCEERLVDVDFDLICSELAGAFWTSAPETALPLVSALQELQAERRRHRDELVRLGTQLRALTQTEDVVHHHLDLPIEHYREQVRQRLFPDLAPMGGPELRGS